MNLQANIRRNAQEMQDFFKGMNTWETKIKKKDKKLKKQEKAGKLHRTLMANEKEIYVLNSNFQESYGWAVLKYKPARYVLHCLQ